MITENTNIKQLCTINSVIRCVLCGNNVDKLALKINTRLNVSIEYCMCSECMRTASDINPTADLKFGFD